MTNIRSKLIALAAVLPCARAGKIVLMAMVRAAAMAMIPDVIIISS